ncbi:MAG: hypothetical protein GY744_11735 [Gammaproteobacteria bacterium]|nr:hypothetical protein [Gammaproteobacteria bacterium]
MNKEKEEKTRSSDDSTPDSSEKKPVELEEVLANFVTSFETSAQRWENTIYPFINSFQSSTKRWERMIYPTMIIFGVMAFSGFWLIYSLTNDVHELARNVDPKMERNLAHMADNISQLSISVESMTMEVKTMRTHIANMDSSTYSMHRDMRAISLKLDTLPPLLLSVQDMDQSMKVMTVNTSRMSYDMQDMNDTIGPPMSFMNTFSPW